MTNKIAMLNYLIENYSKLAGAHHYIWGFTVKGIIYIAVTDETVLPYVCKLDKASRGAGYALRFKPTMDQKLFLMANAQMLCSADYFNIAVAESRYNKGEIFEKMITEKAGQEWHKNNAPFTECGDINIDGIEYQIKFENATFTNEKSLRKMLERA